MPRPPAGDPPAHLPPVAAPAPTDPVPSYVGRPQLPGPSGTGAPTPAGLWNAFRRRWVLGTFLGALAAAAAAVLVWLVMPGGKHEAVAFIELVPRGGEFLAKSSQEDAEAHRRFQMYLLKSRDLITATLAAPEVAGLEFVRQSDEPVNMVERHLKVTLAAPNVIEVRLTGNHLDDLKTYLDSHVKRFVEQSGAGERGRRDDEIKKFEQQAEALRFEIESMEKQIELVGRGNGTTGGEDNAKRLAALQTRHAELDALYNRAGHDLISLNARLDTAKKHLSDKNPAAAPDPALVRELVDADPGVAAARAQLAAKALEYQKALKVADGNETAPIVAELAAEKQKLHGAAAEAERAAGASAVERARAKERAAREREAAGLIDQIAVREKEREEYKLQRDGIKRLIDAGVSGGINIDQMKKALEPQREVLNRMSAHLMGLRVAAKLGGGATPRGPVEKIPNNNQNKKLLLAGAGGLGALAAVVLLVALLEWRTRRVDGVDQVVTELGVRVIGTVPLFPNRADLRAAVAAGGANWRFVLNESVNSARTMLLHTARARSMQVVLVTSATQGEGKTSIAAQLATSMATAGMRALLVDCDLRNPCVQKLFDLPLGPGVSEVLREEVDASEAVQATAVPNLWVVPAGRCSSATIAALAQGHPLETLFNRLRGQFDFVLVDCCPVLPVADALLIAQHVDGVLFSIMQDVSQLPKVQTAQEKLGQLNVALLGAVVNGIKQDVYSYGYNYVKQLPA